MRVRFTVIGVPVVYHAAPTRSVVREAGENPARTRHCHRGSSSHGDRRRSLSRCAREGAEGRPGSQETSLRPPSRTPSWKGVALSMKLSLSPASIAGLLARRSARARRAGDVTVRVEGAARTLRRSARVTTDARVPVSKAAHDCAGTQRRRRARSRHRGQLGGRLLRRPRATYVDLDHGRGARPAPRFWSLWINHKYVASSARARPSCRRATTCCSRSTTCDQYDAGTDTCLDQALPLALTAPAAAAGARAPR